MDNATKPSRYCPNCHYPLPHYGEYCSNCGQKYTTGRIPVWELVRDFAESVFNIDSKIFRTLWALFIPGRLTIQYFKGRHKRYVPPLRLFFIMAVIHFAVLGYVGFDELEQQMTETTEGQWKRAHMEEFREQLDSAAQKVEEAYPNRSVSEALDSLERILGDSRADSMGLGYFTYDADSSKMTLKQIRISTRDAVEMPLDSFALAYGDDSFFSQLQLRQVAKFNRRGGNFTNFVLGKLIWMVVLMMPALALLLKLLYIRRKHYYVEHLVFSFHYHAFAFLIVSAALLVIQTKLEQYVRFLNDGFLLGMAFLWILVYLFVAMRRFYRQHWFKTFIKYSIINFSYTFIFTVFLLLTLAASVLLF
ncbi:MAG: DUF3667 domain-containing protein [Phaeodactylibacter sp.]|nr:DUF3667 domain-containing protein [Phaeodactylibacter sp.]MCB9264952.1 DUF3667 domain-containing protein [Lewinellaceae bacterium]MCB9291016.1 DUF3667 domain-containing protein [Lewinellaceae bacterium]